MKFKQKFISIFLTVTMIISMLPITVNATNDSNDTIITVESATASPGATVDVDVVIENNPGILGATLTFSYDSDLTLITATSGEAFSALDMTLPGSFVSPCNFTWDGLNYLTDDDIKDGVILTLTFEVSEDAQEATNKEINISYKYGDIADDNLSYITATMISGAITVVSYTPGDLNGDELVNAVDIILMRRYVAGGYDVSINEDAADVNDDTNINAIDIILLRRYVAGGYGVELSPSSPTTPEHTHDMTVFDYKAATCTEDGNIAYWYCEECNEYYSDADGNNTILLDDTIIEATGHTVVIDEAVAATYTSTGLTQGSHCSVCGEIIVDQEIIPMLEKEQYAIQYNIYYDESSYLNNISIVNSNPAYYTSEDGLTLLDLYANGYIFEGWYDGAGSNATQIKTISKGATGDVQLYAHWSTIEYEVSFDSPLSPMSKETYTVETGVTLSNAYLEGYTFMCWSDDFGNVVSKIDKGSTGNITLTANWTSKRNQTIQASSLGEPVIHHDVNSNTLLFAYEIGRVENVPLYLIEDLGNKVEGIDYTKETTVSGTITKSSADTIAQAVASATTNTSTWALSEEWNSSTSVSEAYLTENSITVEEATSLGTSSSGTYTLSSSDSGTETTVVQSDSSSSTGTSSSVSAQISNTDSASLSASVGVEASYVGTKVSAEVEAEVSASETSSTGSESGSSYDVTELLSESSSDTKTWNTDEGYESSQTTSSENSITEALTEKISESVSYDISNALSETQSESTTTADTVSGSQEYASTLTYSTETTESSTITYSNANAPAGNYRVVEAGIMHVFAVVTYDIATQAYGIYSYSVLEDDTYAFIDYSKDTKLFDDYENGVLPFEVPYYVNEYVDNLVGASDGLIVDMDTGMIVNYEGTDKIVVIPEYMSVNDGYGNVTVVKIEGFSENAFKGNTDILAVQLCDNITEIPENAFMGCSSLIIVTNSSVKTIGNNAFNGCISMNSYTVSDKTISLGSNAFNGVKSVTVNASASDIADAAIDSGANSIILNLAYITDSYDNRTIEIPESTTYFELNGNGGTYSGLKIKSEATTTVINYITLTDNVGTVLKLGSDNVTLNRVTVNTTGWAMVLTQPSVDLSLYGTVNLNTTGEDAVVCADLSLSRVNSSVYSVLKTTGNVLVYGEIENVSYIAVSDGSIIYIDAATYAELKARWEAGTFSIIFNYNDGSTVYYVILAECDEPIGELPTPSRTGYVFKGWYTDISDGTLISSDSYFSTSDDIMLYAQWESQQYTASWSTITGCSISVNRTSSPYADASIGVISNGDVIYYGDVLSITYTADSGYTLEEKGIESISVTDNVTSSDIYVSATVNSYSASWSTGTGYSIVVNRNSSPNAGATVGVISSGSTIYYGDVLSVTYTASTGYSIATSGSTSITVTENITSSSIYATASANSYTYSIVYQSTNGTSLGTSSATYKYGTTNTISAPSKSGYTTPSSQSVTWDSTSKIITFKYTPSSVSSTTKSGTIDTSPAMTYSATVQYQNRTASSVQIRVVWTTTVGAYSWNSYGQRFIASVGSVSTGTVTVNSYGTWASSSSSSRSSSATSSWITVPLSTTNATTVSLDINYWQVNSNGTDMTNIDNTGEIDTTWSISVPAY